MPAKKNTADEAPEVITLDAAPKKRKERGRSDEVAARHLTLDGMREGAGPLVVHSAEKDENGEFVTDDEGNRIVLAEYRKAFVVTDDMLGVKGGSIPVTIGTWAKDRGLSVGTDLSVVSQYTGENARIVTFS